MKPAPSSIWNWARVVAAVSLLFVLFNVPAFLKHWSDATDDYRQAKVVLQMGSCTNVQVMAEAPKFVQDCTKARDTISIPPFLRAVFNTLGDWNVCREQWCMLTVFALFNNVGTYAIVILVALVAWWLLASSRQRGTLMPQYVVVQPPSPHVYTPHQALQQISWDDPHPHDA